MLARRNPLVQRSAAQAGARVVVCDVDEAAMAALCDVPGIATRPLDVMRQR